MKLRNWRTTLSGAATLLLGIWLIVVKGNYESGLACITTGAGLIAAKDYATHSTPEEVQRSGSQEVSE